MVEPGPNSAVLRFGVMCSSHVLRAWQARCLDFLAGVPSVELVLLVIDARMTPRRSHVRRIVRPNAVWDAYNNLYVARRSRALRSVDLTARLSDVPTLCCEVEQRGRYSEYFGDADLEAIAGHGLDFLLRFGFGIVRGDILDLPRLGVWSFHHDDEEWYRGGPPAFWELVDGAPVTGAVLQRLTERLDGGIVLKKGFFRTVRHSYVRNTDEVHLGSAEWPAQVCRDVQRGVADYLEMGPSLSEARIYRKPTNRQAISFLARLSARFVRSQVRRVMVNDQWNVGVVDAPIERFVDESFRPSIRWWPHPRHRSRYLADPFGVVSRGRRTVLAEAYDYRTREGSIDWFTDDDGVPARGGRVLFADGHASYPFLLQHGGDVLCAPQLGSARGIHLFRASRFPLEWERVAVLAEGTRALDPTLVQHDGYWWIFFTDADDGPFTKLRIWWAEDVTGPWRPHHANPVKTDVRSSRPAGTPFVVEGALYRPAQDCSRTYGGAVAVNQVRVLTPLRFREEAIRVVAPPAGGFSRGMHTLAAFDDKTLVDGKRHVFSLSASITELRAGLRPRSRR